MTKIKSMNPSKISRQPIVPSRIRSIGNGGFCFIPHRFLHDGFFASLTPHEMLLYFFLILAGDRNGMSFYHYDRICDLLLFVPDDYLCARNGLIEKELLAFDGSRFQVLEIPETPYHSQTSRPLKTEDDFANSDPATIRQLLRTRLDKE